MDENLLRLYFIMGSNQTAGRDPLIVLKQALRGGITMFQLREKGDGALTGLALRSFAEDCQALCREYGVPFIVNDDVSLAIELDADGVHVGQDDAPAASIRDKWKENKLIGVSVHNRQEMEAAVAAGADYAGMGPVYGTVTKTDARQAAGTGMIEEMNRLYPSMPVVGIGGITEVNFAPVLRAGAEGIAVISAIAAAADPQAAARTLKSGVVQALKQTGEIML